MTAQHLNDLEITRRHATLVAVVLEAKATVIDQIVDLHDRIIGTLFNRAKNALPLDRAVDCRAVQIRHVQITHDEVVGLLREPLEGGLAAADAVDVLTLAGEDQLEHFSHVGVVVDYEDARHLTPSAALLAEQA